MKSVTLSLLQSAANAFDFGGPVLCDAHHYGEGAYQRHRLWSGGKIIPNALFCSASTQIPFTNPGGPDGECLRRDPASAGENSCRGRRPSTGNAECHPNFVGVDLLSGCRRRRMACLRLCRRYHLFAAGRQRNRLPHRGRDTGQIPEPAGGLPGLHPPRNHCPLPRHAQPLCQF